MSQFLEMKESSRFKLNIFLVCFNLTLSCFLLLSSYQSLYALEFKDLWNNHSSKTLKHWNHKKKKVTGYTEIDYITSDDEKSLIEISKNLHEDKKVFSEKKLWFDSSGNLFKYEEIDLKSGFKTQNLYEKKQIKTQIWEKGKKTSFSIPRDDNLVPFEIVSHYLQNRVSELKKRSSFKIDLYLPAIALELKNKGFPTSFSIIEMKVKVSDIKTAKTLIGEMEVVVLQIRPTSFLINALLPEEKSVFWFTFLREPPFELISFKEGQTEFILESIEPLATN